MGKEYDGCFLCCDVRKQGFGSGLERSSGLTHEASVMRFFRKRDRNMVGVFEGAFGSSGRVTFVARGFHIRQFPGILARKGLSLLRIHLP